MKSESFRLDPDTGRPLFGVLDVPDRGDRWPVVVICHGFKGFFEWGFFPHIASLLAERGFAVVRFNFSGSGMKPGDERVTDLDAFRSNTLSREAEDLRQVLAAVGGEIGGDRLDADRIGLVGHSRGGAAALAVSAGDEWRERIGSLVTWSAIGRIDRFPPKVMDDWRRDGELEILNARTGQRLALGPTLLAEIEAPPPALDLARAAGRRRAPWLIVHGTEDETVPAEEAKMLAEAAAQPAALELIEGGSHTFGARHPWVGPTRAMIQTFNLTQSWLRRTLA